MIFYEKLLWNLIGPNLFEIEAYDIITNIFGPNSVEDNINKIIYFDLTFEDKTARKTKDFSEYVDKFSYEELSSFEEIMFRSSNDKSVVVNGKFQGKLADVVYREVLKNKGCPCTNMNFLNIFNKFEDVHSLEINKNVFASSHNIYKRGNDPQRDRKFVDEIYGNAQNISLYDLSGKLLQYNGDGQAECFGMKVNDLHVYADNSYNRVRGSSL